MSRFAQIRSAISDRPWEWLLYLLGAVYLFVVWGFGFGLVGILVAFVAVALFGHYFISHIRRFPRFKLSEIGTIEMDIAGRSAGDLSPKIAFGSFIAVSVLWTLMACAEGVVILLSHFRDVGDVPNLRTFVGHVVWAAGCAAFASIGYRNQSRRLLVTGQGLFQVLDVMRPWATDRPLDEPQSPLRTMQLYRWEQVARFHWSQERGVHALHLNVRQPWIRVPQLVSYKFPKLTDELWHQLEQLLHKHIAVGTAEEPGRALTTSATV
jgi:hypothetical protein